MKLNEEQITESLPKTMGWQREGNQLVWHLKFADFKSAMTFVNRVADEAEAMDHHPDIFLHDCNKVRLSLTTHSEGGLTAKDFRLAERINQFVN